MILFTHLKIILLQCFQFSAINGIQTDSKKSNLNFFSSPSAPDYLYIKELFFLLLNLY